MWLRPSLSLKRTILIFPDILIDFLTDEWLNTKGYFFLLHVDQRSLGKSRCHVGLRCLGNVLLSFLYHLVTAQPEAVWHSSLIIHWNNLSKLLKPVLPVLVFVQLGVSLLRSWCYWAFLELYCLWYSSLCGFDWCLLDCMQLLIFRVEPNKRKLPDFAHQVV